MTKLDFVNVVAETMGTTKKAAAAAIDGVMDAVTKVLKDGDCVKLTGFGTFNVTERAAHEGHNPSTGEKLMIEAKKRVTFKPGATLKDAVNE